MIKKKLVFKSTFKIFTKLKKKKCKSGSCFKFKSESLELVFKQQTNYIG